MRRIWFRKPGISSGIAYSTPLQSDQRGKANTDDGTLVLNIPACMEQSDISAGRAGGPQIEQCRVLRDRARDRPDTEVVQSEPTDDVRGGKQVDAVPSDQRKHLGSRAQLERLHAAHVGLPGHVPALTPPQSHGP